MVYLFFGAMAVCLLIVFLGLKPSRNTNQQRPALLKALISNRSNNEQNARALITSDQKFLFQVDDERIQLHFDVWDKNLPSTYLVVTATINNIKFPRWFQFKLTMTGQIHVGEETNMVPFSQFSDRWPNFTAFEALVELTHNHNYTLPLINIQDGNIELSMPTEGVDLDPDTQAKQCLKFFDQAMVALKLLHAQIPTKSFDFWMALFNHKNNQIQDRVRVMNFLLSFHSRQPEVQSTWSDAIQNMPANEFVHFFHEFPGNLYNTLTNELSNQRWIDFWKLTQWRAYPDSVIRFIQDYCYDVMTPELYDDFDVSHSPIVYLVAKHLWENNIDAHAVIVQNAERDVAWVQLDHEIATFYADIILKADLSPDAHTMTKLVEFAFSTQDVILIMVNIVTNHPEHIAKPEWSKPIARVLFHVPDALATQYVERIIQYGQLDLYNALHTRDAVKSLTGTGMAGALMTSRMDEFEARLHASAGGITLASSDNAGALSITHEAGSLSPVDD